MAHILAARKRSNLILKRINLCNYNLSPLPEYIISWKYNTIFAKIVSFSNIIPFFWKIVPYFWKYNTIFVISNVNFFQICCLFIKCNTIFFQILITLVTQLIYKAMIRLSLVYLHDILFRSSSINHIAYYSKKTQQMKTLNWHHYQKGWTRLTDKKISDITCRERNHF